jgi:putative membrane-bound dehydrogenase-like protein
MVLGDLRRIFSAIAGTGHLKSVIRARGTSIAAILSFLLGALMVGTSRGALPEVPAGFKIRLVAAVPAVQFPSQVATAPDGALFVGEDPMDQTGPADKPIDRILLFREGMEPVVFADKLCAIFGMVWHEGALYVMNMPHLTVLRDRNGDGRADQREDLFVDLGVPAGSPNDLNDHIVSGLKIGMDGRLYISVGDKGVPRATGPEGWPVQLRGGGVLRCRLDGTRLEVYSSGTRNHLEPNLDERDNLFTYDNTDDGLGWWTRVTHHIDGGYYGYPFDYHTRTDRMLPRMAEYGGGSPCGGVFYGDDIWPETYRGRLLWAEWGKRAVQAFRFVPDGSTFKVADVIDFVKSGDVESFRPIDLALAHDGRTLYIADWSTGGWNLRTEKLGRIYAVSFADEAKVKTRPRGNNSEPEEAQIRQLGHPSYHERLRAQAALIRRGKAVLFAVTGALADSGVDPIAKRHLVWVLDAIAGGTPEASYPLIDALKSPAADVRAEAARALGEREVPLAREALVELLKDREPTVRLQAVIALGRIASRDAVAALLPLLAEPDVFLAYSVRQALRRISDWPEASRGLDSPDAKVRTGLLSSMEQVFEESAVQALARFAATPGRPADERVRAVAFLSEVDRQAPAWDGSWWGTQPAQQQAPARTVAWAGTTRVLATIRQLTTDRSAPVRAAAIMAVVATNDRESTALLRERFRDEKDTEVRRNIALALGQLADRDALALLAAELENNSSPQPVRDAALDSVALIGTDKAVTVLVDLLDKKALSAERQPHVITTLARLQSAAAVRPLLALLRSPAASVRSAAVDGLVTIVKTKPERGRNQVVSPVRSLLSDRAVEVRNSAITAAAELEDRAAIPALLAASESPDSRFEASLALTRLPDIRALQTYLRGLTDKNPGLREASSGAISKLRDEATPVLDQLAGRNELSPDLLPELRAIYAYITPVASWRVLGPFDIAAEMPLPAGKAIDFERDVEGFRGQRVRWKTVQAIDDHGQVDLGRVYSNDDDRAAYGYAEVESQNERAAQIVVGSDDTLTVWLNGEQVYEFLDRRGFEPEQARFNVRLRQGKNRLFLRCGNRGGSWQFALAVTAPADFAFLKAPSALGFNPESYRAAALKGQGRPERGRKLFSDLKGLACLKCHSVGKEGAAFGPELTSVGTKYPRDELIAAVLYPSAKISSGYEATTFLLTDGRVLTGIVRGESGDAVEIQDGDAKLIKISKSNIDARKRSEVSIMPSGLAQGLSTQDFADLVAYLETLKNPK